MILFITTPGLHGTLTAVVDRPFAADLPVCRATTYPALFKTATTVNAVHVFTDLERLSDTDLARAATLYRRLRAAGIRCLNDPARVMTRYQLLTALKEAGINPFGVYRADGLPKPRRFPVFVRGESDHYGPMSELLHDQEALDLYLASLREAGRPLRGLIVTEFAAEPITPELWRRYGTYRVGDNYYVHIASVARQWAVKKMDETVPAEYFEAERVLVAANEPEEAVIRAFEISGIEWGRADHGIVGGRHVIYEINTNPLIEVRPKASEIRLQTRLLCIEHMTRCLRAIDAGDGREIAFEPVGRPRRKRWYRRLLQPLSSARSR
jgi:hypothetical protein